MSPKKTLQLLNSLLVITFILFAFVDCSSDNTPDVEPDNYPDTLRTGHLIEVVEPLFNFGYVKSYGNEIAHTFTIKNIGTDTLRILNVNPGCGCTSFSSFDSTLAPTEFTDIVISLRTIGYEGYLVSKFISITTNDTMQPAIILNIQANIDSTFSRITAQPCPMYVDIDSTETEHIVLVNNTSTENYLINVYEYPEYYFDLLSPETQELSSSESCSFNLLYNPEDSLNIYNRSITFSLYSPTDGSEQLRVTSPIVFH